MLGPLQVVAGDSDSAAGGLRAPAANRAGGAAVAGEPAGAGRRTGRHGVGRRAARWSAEAVRALVMRLRRGLGQQAAARIVTRATGYAIEVSSDELDASRREALTIRPIPRSAPVNGRKSANRGGGAGPVAGHASGGYTFPAAAGPVGATLERLHAQVLAGRIEADLHKGRHEQLIPELQELTARDPLRESFHGQLMLALAGSGRRAEALAAYQNARHTLAAELGIEPGGELRLLHERILAGDAILTAPPAADAPGAVPAEAVPAEAAPAQRPRLPGSCPRQYGRSSGRQAEAGRLDGLVRQTAKTAGGSTVVISAIDGMAGVGKTALAIHAAHRLAGEFPDGQLFIDMHGYTQGHEPRRPGEALEMFLRALGVPPHASRRHGRARRDVPPAAGRHQDDDRAGQRRQRGAGPPDSAGLGRVPGAGHQPPPAQGPGRSQRTDLGRTRTGGRA